MKFDIKHFHFLGIIFLCFKCCYSSKPELVFVNIVFRHGARTPIKNFPNNPNSNVWNEKPGQLTMIGVKQHYELGQFLRTRYNSILSETYKSDEIYVRSTDVDRTLMSAEANLAGLYPPKGFQKWNGSFTTWQPIPVHTVSKDDEYLLNFPNTICSKYMNDIYPAIHSSKSYLDFVEANQELIDKVTRLSGQSDSNIFSLWNVQDVVECEKVQNVSSAKWITEEIYNQMSAIIAKEMTYDAGGVTQDFRLKAAKLGSGNLLKKIIENMKTKITSPNSPKLTIYSAHDTTLAALLTALDDYNDIIPPFASAIIFELHRYNTTNNTSNYFVKVVYRNSTKTDLVKLRPFGLPVVCKLENFIANSQKYIPDDIKQECNPTKNSALSSVTISLSCLILFLAVCILVMGFTTRTKSQRGKSSSYEPLLRKEESKFDDGV